MGLNKYNSLDAVWEGSFFSVCAGDVIIRMKFNGVLFQVQTDSFYMVDFLKKLYVYDPVLFGRGRLEVLRDDNREADNHWTCWCANGQYADRGDKPTLIFSHCDHWECHWQEGELGCSYKIEKHSFSELQDLGYLDD